MTYSTDKSANIRKTENLRRKLFPDLKSAKNFASNKPKLFLRVSSPLMRVMERLGSESGHFLFILDTNITALLNYYYYYHYYYRIFILDNTSVVICIYTYLHCFPCSPVNKVLLKHINNIRRTWSYLILIMSILIIFKLYQYY